jgi:glycosyltransferase involved in cell wall biosynthesis
MSTVSAIVPTYNRAETVCRAIDSVINQTYSGIEIIVVDDSSTDNTREKIEKYNNEVRYIRHKKNKGAAAARNTGIKHSNGKYIAFIDSDDEWHKMKIEKQLSEFSNSPSDVGVVYTGFYQQSADQREIGRIPRKKGDIFKDQLKKDWVSPTSTVMIKSSCFENSEVFNTELAARQDYELWIRLSQEYQFSYVKEPLATIHIDREDRITGDVSSRINAHKQVIDQIEQDIHNLPWYERRQAFSAQNYTMGRYLQNQNEKYKAAAHLARSITLNPFNWKSFLALCLVLTGQDMQMKTVRKAKNKIRAYK